MMLPLVSELPNTVTLKKAAELLHFKNFTELSDSLLKAKTGQYLLKDFDESTTLVIKKRLLHVYSEAYRAHIVRQLLEKAPVDDDDYLLKVQMLADAIEDSHQSCRDDYECSCTELNECIKAAMSAGCFAGRLTGAGMGGYAVGLVHV